MKLKLFLRVAALRDLPRGMTGIPTATALISRFFGMQTNNLLNSDVSFSWLLLYVFLRYFWKGLFDATLYVVLLSHYFSSEEDFMTNSSAVFGIKVMYAYSYTRNVN